MSAASSAQSALTRQIQRLAVKNGTEGCDTDGMRWQAMVKRRQ
jgi:hypothetical protein